MRRTHSCLIALALLLSVPAHGDGAGGTVTLPLADYLRLVERVEAARRAPAEPGLAALTRQATALTVGDGAVEATSTFRVELRGRPTSPVALPVTGLAESATVEPRRGAAVHRTAEGLLLVAPEPGSYTVTVRSRPRLEDPAGVRLSGVSRLTLAETRAPVAALDLDLPQELRWKLDGAVVVGESLAADRRRLRLAPARGGPQVLELRRRLAGTEEERVRARSVVVTVARLRDGAVERHDVVLYEVARGELGRFAVDLPPLLEVERAATDEGSALPYVDQGRLVVERRGRLAGVGHLAVTFRALAPDAAGEVPLEPIAPRVPVRSRYLLLASDRAAEVEPLPAGGWSRVDVEDLPRNLRPAVAALGPAAVWRFTGGEGDGAAAPRLRAALLDPVEPLGAVVWRRSTTTLLTVDGSLVHRDHLTVRRPGAALELALPAGATLWSARVDGQPVRPLERGAAIVVPLAPGYGGETRVELVAVEERSIARGRSQLGVAAARLELPVLEHQWRLLLPERHRYRLAASELRPAPPGAGSPAMVFPRVSFVDEISGDSGITGAVADGNGDPIPGAMVTARPAVGDELLAVTDERGRFSFRRLAPDAYRVRAALEGFDAVETTVAVSPGRTARLEVTLPLTAVEELIVVTAEVPGAAFERTDEVDEELDRERMRVAARNELRKLQQGLVGGVKPLAVEIPESGKLLLLAGALPPVRVGVELEVRAGR